ncbi:hypothetical protein GCM10011392_40370 [Wenxinia marina]|nr:hypothetical protein GCM10011392_40370 [Wenxinia marina]
MVSDAHEGIKAATARVLSTTWQRCRVHFQRNALAHAGKSSRRVVSAFIATAFAQPDHATAKAQWRLVADQMRPKLPKLAAAHGYRRGRRASLHDLPGPAPRQASQHKSGFTAQIRSSA